MRGVIPLIGVCLLLAAAAEPAFAQQRLFALTPSEIVEVDTNLSSLGRVIRRVPAPTGVRFSSGDPSPIAVAGGALLAWVDGGRLALFDIHSGAFQRHVLPVSGINVLGTSADSFTVLVSGFGPTITSKAVAFVDVRQGTVRVLDLGAGVIRVVHAPKSDLLLVERLGVLARDVEVRRTADGALLKTLSIAPEHFPSSLSVNAWGTRLFVSGGEGLLSFDVASGALLARNPAYPSSLPQPILDEHRRRFLVQSPPGFASTPLFIAALSIDTLQVIGVTTVPAPPSTPGLFSALQTDVSDRSATIFALTTVFRELRDVPDPVCNLSTLAALKVDTGQMRRSVDLTSVTGTANCYVRLVRVTEPAAPSSFSASVTGRSVSLSWGAEAATHYELEAGTGPGLTNLARLNVDGTQLTVDNVPPGVYHLRVRAINTIGRSLPSREITITVP